MKDLLSNLPSLFLEFVLPILATPTVTLGEVLLWVLTGGARGLDFDHVPRLSDEDSFADGLEAWLYPKPRHLVSHLAGIALICGALVAWA